MTEAFKKAGLETYFENSYGWALFPTVAKAGIGIGGAGGSGRVFAKVDGGEAKQVGTASLMQLSFGFQFGGQVYSEIIFFEGQKDFENFTSGNFEFGAGASVVALTASANASTTTAGSHAGAGVTSNHGNLSGGGGYSTKGMAVFSIAIGGLMYQATIAGQKFNYSPL
jgi:lipid-binding SYLF domain-containing protein